MEIYKCSPQSCPENIYEDMDEDVVYKFVIGETREELEQEYVGCKYHHRFGYRKYNKGKNRWTWCGKHPNFWREPTINELKKKV